MRIWLLFYPSSSQAYPNSSISSPHGYKNTTSSKNTYLPSMVSSPTRIGYLSPPFSEKGCLTCPSFSTRWHHLNDLPRWILRILGRHHPLPSMPPTNSVTIVTAWHRPNQCPSHSTHSHRLPVSICLCRLLFLQRLHVPHIHRLLLKLTHNWEILWWCKGTHQQLTSCLCHLWCPRGVSLGWWTQIWSHPHQRVPAYLGCTPQVVLCCLPTLQQQSWSWGQVSKKNHHQEHRTKWLPWCWCSTKSHPPSQKHTRSNN